MDLREYELKTMPRVLNTASSMIEANIRIHVIHFLYILICKYDPNV